MQAPSSTTPTSTPSMPAGTPPPWMNTVWGVVIGLIVAFVVWGGATMLSDVMNQQVQKEYLLLTDDASRASFARRHLNHPLGGLVLLGQAHDYYAQGNYAAAKEAYEKAVMSGLKKEPVLHQEAMLGLAFATYALNPQEGLAALKTIAQNSELMDTTRAHAAAELLGYYAAQAKTKADWKQARDYWQLIQTLQNAKPWQQHVEHLGEIYPQLTKE